MLILAAVFFHILFPPEFVNLVVPGAGICLCSLFFLCCRMAYIEFKSEADANKALEEKQGAEVDGRAMVIDYTGEKSQQEHQKGTCPDQ